MKRIFLILFSSLILLAITSEESFACVDTSMEKIGSSKIELIYFVGTTADTLTICSTPKIKKKDPSKLKFFGILFPESFRATSKQPHKILSLVGYGKIISYEYKPKTLYCVNLQSHNPYLLQEFDPKTKDLSIITLSPKDSLFQYWRNWGRIFTKVLRSKQDPYGAMIGSPYVERHRYSNLRKVGCETPPIQWQKITPPTTSDSQNKPNTAQKNNPPRTRPH